MVTKAFVSISLRRTADSARFSVSFCQCCQLLAEHSGQSGRKKSSQTFEKVLPSFLNQKFAIQQHLRTLHISHCSTYYLNIYYNIFLFHCLIFYRQNIFMKSIYIVQIIFYLKAGWFPGYLWCRLLGSP